MPGPSSPACSGPTGERADSGPAHAAWRRPVGGGGGAASGFYRQALRWAGLLAILLVGHFAWPAALAMAPWGVLAFWFAARQGCPPWVGWPLARAGLLALQCVIATPPAVRQHDVEGHREYVDYVSANVRLPEVRQGWETFQPPLYYLVAAVWRWIAFGVPQADPFRSVQWLAAVIYLGTVALALVAYRRLGLNDSEIMAAAALLALVPGHLFFAARINNDVLLPLLGVGVLLLTGKFVESGQRGLLTGLSLLLAGILATKGSSLAVVAGSLALVFWSEARRSDWRRALGRAYLTGLPAGLWLLFWCWRTAAQTGEPFYVNAALPDDLLLHSSPWGRMVSFKFGAFLAGHFYYDDAMRHSYFTALVTSLLYGEYGMGEYAFRCPQLFRWGCLGVLVILLVGAVVPPRRELRPAWLTCLCLGICQLAITMAYALEYPFACNQNMRFFAQALAPLAGLFGMGVGRLWRVGRWHGRLAVALIMGAFLTGAADFYARVFF